MSEAHDPETGEIILRRAYMAPEISKAIITVMKGVKQLGFDEHNPHAKYNYASIDKFLSHFGPACADAGIFVSLDEVSADVRTGGKEGSAYLFIEYDVWVIHESGAMWGPLRRRCYLPATGPQAFGSAESYVLKRFMRNLFQVPTGEKDADDMPDGDIPASTAAAPTRRAPTRPTAATHPPRYEEAKAALLACQADVDGAETVDHLLHVTEGLASLQVLMKEGSPGTWEAAMERLHERIAAREKILRGDAP